MKITLIRRFMILALALGISPFLVNAKVMGSTGKNTYMIANTSLYSTIPIPTITVFSSGYNSIKISWTAVTAVRGYEIHRAASASGKYTKVYTATSGSSLNYTNTGLNTGANYYYKVRAYRLVGSSKVYGSFSTIKNAKPALAKPTITVVMSSSDNIKVTWNAVNGASGYEVHGATSASGLYTKIYTATSGLPLNYTNTDLNTSVNYYYKVRAYRLVGSSKVYGSFSTVKNVIPILTLPPPKSLSASTYNYQSVQLYYDIVQNATKYRIYYSKTPSSDINTYLYFDYTNKDCRVIGLDAGTTYYFRVASVDSDNRVGIPTGFVVATTSSSPGIPPQPKFYLNGIDMAGSKYRMKFFRSTSPIYPAEYEPLYKFYVGIDSNNMAFDCSCDNSQYFYYDVNPGQSLWYGFTANYGPYASTMQKINVAALGSPTNVTADGVTKYNGIVYMNWSPVYAASSYNIYYCITGPYPGQSWFDFKSSTGSYLHYLANTSSTSSQLTGVPTGLQYTFIVVPVNSSGAEGWYCGYAITGVLR